MKEENLLKKEGIELVSVLSDKVILNIADKVSKKICNTFPEHHLNQKNIYAELSNTKMYFADFTSQNVGAKYYYKNHTFYFNRKYNKKRLTDLATHEIIHFIQEKRTPKGKLERFGLHDFDKLEPTGMGINEAAVQLMSVKVNKTKPDYVKYYGLNLYTPSPDYYPIQCALLNQISYFIGTFPIFHSTLYSDDVFKTTLITKTSKKTYKYIEDSFDMISEYEDKLSSILYTISTSSDSAITQKLNKKIEHLKANLQKTIIETQEKILTECFNFEINNVRDIKTISEIKNRLLNFKKYLIQNDDYSFFDLFISDAFGKLEEKEYFINNYGIQYYFNNNNQYLPILSNKYYGITVFAKYLSKLKNVFNFNKNTKINQKIT